MKKKKRTTTFKKHVLVAKIERFALKVAFIGRSCEASFKTNHYLFAFIQFFRMVKFSGLILTSYLAFWHIIGTTFTKKNKKNKQNVAKLLRLQIFREILYYLSKNWYICFIVFKVF